MNEMSPCKGCTNRHTACHDSCEAYKEWKERYQAQQKHLETYKNRWQAPWTADGERRARGNIKRGPGSYKGGMQ